MDKGFFFVHAERSVLLGEAATRKCFSQIVRVILFPQAWDNFASTFDRILPGFLDPAVASISFLRRLDAPLLENLLNTSLWLLRPGVAQFCKGFAVRSGT